MNYENITLNQAYEEMEEVERVALEEAMEDIDLTVYMTPEELEHYDMLMDRATALWCDDGADPYDDTEPALA